MAIININIPDSAVAASSNAKQLTEAAKAASIAACKAWLEVMEKPASMFASNDADSGEKVA